MVDIVVNVGLADCILIVLLGIGILLVVVAEVNAVVDGGKDIRQHDMLGDKVILTCDKHVFKLFPFKSHIKDLLKYGIVYLFVKTAFLGIKAKEAGGVNKEVGEHYLLLVLHLALVVLATDNDLYLINTAVFNGAGLLAGNNVTLGGKKLARVGIDNVAKRGLTLNARTKSQLLAELIAAHSGKIVALMVKEGVAYALLHGLHGSVFTGTQLLVHLGKTVHMAGNGRIALLVTLECKTEYIADIYLIVICLGAGGLARIVTKSTYDLLVGAHICAQSAKKGGDGGLTRTVHLYLEDVLLVDLVLQPGTAVRYKRSGILLLLGSVDLLKIYTGATYQLAGNNTLGAVYNERTGRSHKGEITHKDVLLDDVAYGSVLIFDRQAHSDLHRSGIGSVALLALFYGILGLKALNTVAELVVFLLIVHGSRKLFFVMLFLFLLGFVGSFNNYRLTVNTLKVAGKKLKLHILRKIVNGRKILDDAAELGSYEVLERVLLDLNKIAYLLACGDTGKTLSGAFSHLHFVKHTFTLPYNIVPYSEKVGSAQISLAFFTLM